MARNNREGWLVGGAGRLDLQMRSALLRQKQREEEA